MRRHIQAAESIAQEAAAAKVRVRQCRLRTNVRLFSTTTTLERANRAPLESKPRADSITVLVAGVQLAANTMAKFI
jgi:hypothetical protein